MSISIAMATYNGAKYLQAQLDSLVCQTLQPDELVVCDDSSTDATVEILKSFRKSAPFPVHIYRNEKNLGYIRSFERSLARCSGEIIFLSDQDDVWFKNKTEEMTVLLNARPEIFVLQADMVLADKDMNPSRYTQLKNIFNLGHSRNMFVTGCGTAIRKQWLEIVLPIPAELVAHDSWIHRLSLAMDVRAIHERPLLYYRRHCDNASNWLASKTVKLTELDAFREHGFRDATSGWRQELERVKATRQRLIERAETFKTFGLADRQTVALSILASHMEALNSRLKVVAVSRLRRVPKVLELWIKGGYEYFSGWKSAAKDILRP